MYILSRLIGYIFCGGFYFEWFVIDSEMQIYNSLLTSQYTLRLLGIFVLTAWVFQSSVAQNNVETESKTSKIYNIKETSSFEISGTFRTRLESLNAEFRPGRIGDSGILSLRSSLKGEYITPSANYVLELADSRHYLADDITPRNNSIVNTYDILQGYVQLNFRNNLDIEKGNLKFGKFTMDVGSRRLVARNRFRNTINSFLGIKGSFIQNSRTNFQGFVVLPVHRLPDQHEILIDNEAAFDRVSEKTMFAGITVSRWNANHSIKGEFFLFGLKEGDVSWRPSRDRRLLTFGPRLTSKKETGKLDYEIESYFQIGRSSASSNPASEDLSHFAHFQHIYLGYTFYGKWKPRVMLLFDYASGDKDPGDDKNNRFDTLFGARRSDFGPTSIYGAFARSNLFSPGYKLEIRPISKGSIEFFHRYFALASAYDVWTTSKIIDPSGNSGSELGHQIDIRVRYMTFQDKVKMEAGITRLFTGQFIMEAPNSNRNENHTYCYVQMAYHF